MNFLPFAILPFIPWITGAYAFPKLVAVCVILSIVFFVWFIQDRDIKVDMLSVLLFVFTLWTVIRYSGVASQLENPFLWPVLLLIGVIRKDLSKPLLWVAAIACGYGVLQILGWDIGTYKHAAKFIGFTPDARPFSFFGNPNWFGEFLVGVLPLTLAKWIWLSPICLILVIATGSRAAMLGMVAGLAFYFIRQKEISKKLAVGGIVLILVALLVAPWAWEKLTTTTTMKSRLLWWTVTGQMIKAHPLAGVGAEKFREEYPGYQGRYFQDHPSSKLLPYVNLTWGTNPKGTLESPHNEFLSVGAEYGLPALLLFLGILLLIFKYAPPWAGGGALGLTICSLFGYPFHEAGNLILLGCLTASVQMPAPRLQGRPIVIILLALSIFLTVGYARLGWVGLHVFAATQENIWKHPDQALKVLATADRFSRPDALIDVQKAKAYLLKNDRKSAFWALQRIQRGFDPPSIYQTLAIISGHPDLYLSKLQLYYPGVKR